MTKFFAYSNKPPKPLIRYPDIWAAIKALSRIHDGIKGQSIPAVVMDFYRAMKGGDRHRPDMLREVVLAMDFAIQNGVRCRRALHDTAMEGLAGMVARLPDHRLEQWLRDHPRRAKFIPAASNTRLDRLRAAWLEEGREVITDVMDYADAMTRRRC